MSKSKSSLKEFKANIEELLGQQLTEKADKAVEDFWNYWSSFDELISQNGLVINVDALFLSHAFPQYSRYHVWKGAGKIAILGGIISIWFLWQLGAILFFVGIALHLFGNKIKFKDAKKFSDEIIQESKYNSLDKGYVNLCANYITGIIQLVSAKGSAHWPQYPSSVITGDKSLISMQSS